MKAIVAVDANWGIGCEGKLLQPIPEDLKFFKEKTMGKIVVMGRETFYSLPNQAPLKDRTNIVLTRNETFCDERLIVCHSVEETLEKLKQFESDQIFIIGGESIYKAFLPYCDELFVTKVQKEYVADRFFPNIDEEKEWELKSEGEVKQYHDIYYRFNRYVRV